MCIEFKPPFSGAANSLSTSTGVILDWFILDQFNLKDNVMTANHCPERLVTIRSCI